MEEIIFNGKVTKNLYNSESFKIYAIKPDKDSLSKLKLNNYGNITIVGDMQNLDTEVTYKIIGVEEVGKYGIQYKISSVERNIPTSYDDSLNFLKSVISENLSKKILEVYPNIIDMIMNDKPINTENIKGVGEKTLDRLKLKVQENFQLLPLIKEFKDYEMTLKMLKKLKERYKSVENIRGKLESDPYKCLCNINRVGFLKADEMILRAKPHLINSKQRCKSCIIYCLEQNELNGNTCIKYNDLKNFVINSANECSHHLYEILKEENDEISTLRNGMICKSKMFLKEYYIANKILELDDCKENIWDVDIEKYKENLTDTQLKSLDNLCKSNISILRGYAGTGKTTSVKNMITMLDDLKKTYLLFAPTGKASKRLSESTKREASTIHRGLGFSPTEKGMFFYDEDNPINCDVLFIDESTMTDVNLMCSIMRAIEIGRTKLVLIGDTEQLPSIGAGNVLYDIIQYGKIPMVELTEVFRYGEGGLDAIATDIRMSETFIKNDFQGVKNFGANNDFSLINLGRTQSYSAIQTIYTQLINSGVDIKDIMIISSLNVRDYGTVMINKFIQKLRNPNLDNSIKVKDNFFCLNDRVMQIENNYSAKVYKENTRFGDEEELTSIFNGETGTIVQVNSKNIIVEFDDGLMIEYDKSNIISNLVLAYCCTVHKLQGSECENVIFLLDSSHSFFLNKNIVYVAVTRAKKRIYCLAEPKTLNGAIKKTVTDKRLTTMSYCFELLLKKRFGLEEE